MVDWTSFKNIILPDDVTQIHIDTRDFAVIINSDDHNFDISKVKKYPKRFFHTIDEVKSTIEDLHIRSGGEGTWRSLWLEGLGEKYSENWNLKYLRIYKTSLGFVICGNDERALSKDVLGSKMTSKEIINYH